MSGWQFPNWNYGYTQMPAYNYYQGRPGMGHPGSYPMTPQGTPAPPPPLPPTPAPPTKTTAAAPTTTPIAPGVIKKEAVIKKEPTVAAAAATTSQTVAPEEGEIVEKSIIGILKGRNPVMFCNDQSKMRGLHMEWEQVFFSSIHIYLIFLTFSYFRSVR